MARAVRGASGMSAGWPPLPTNSQGPVPVPVGDRQVVQVCAAGFRDPQGIEPEQTRQHVVVASGQTGLDQERAELVAVQPDPGRLLGDLGRRTWTAGECSSSCSSTQYR